jgi:hypothetical protein
MTKQILILGVLLSLPAGAVQTKVKPLTVCEVVSNLKAYNGKTIAVVGWLEGTEEGNWLDEEGCVQRLQTNSFTWPNALWLQYEASAPRMSGVEKLTDRSILRQKLSEVVSREKPPSPQKHLAVLYGRLETREVLETYVGGDGNEHGVGFGHVGYAPAQLVFSDLTIKTLFEGEVKSASKKRNR